VVTIKVLIFQFLDANAIQAFNITLKEYAKEFVVLMKVSSIIYANALKTMSEILMESVFISLHNNAQPFQAGMELTVFAKLDTSS
jgi:hypothetical protein